MAIKRYSENPRVTTVPTDADIISIEQGTTKTFEDMKVITYGNLMKPVNDDIDELKGDVYTQTEIDDALALKATSDDVYTQTEIDDALALKQSKNPSTTVTELADTDAIQVVGDKKISVENVKETLGINNLQNQIDGKVYGIQINHLTGEESRTGDAVGLNFGTKDGVNAIVSDFDHIYPWRATEQYKQNEFGVIKRPNEDGYETFNGSLRNKYAKAWFRDITIGHIRTISISNVKRAGYTEVDPPAIDAMHAGDDNGILRAKAGLAPKVNISYTGFLNALSAQGDGLDRMYDMKAFHYITSLSVVEAGTLDHKSAYGRGINSNMPYSSSDIYKAIQSSTNANTITLSSAGQPFYIGMDVQIGTSYTNNSIASNRKITNISDNGTYLVITVDGEPFNTNVGSAIVTWGQSVSQEAVDAIGLGSGYYLQHGSENRSPVCYRGTWNLWGNIWCFTTGFMRYNGQYYGCTDPSKMNITDPRNADGWVDLGLNIQSADGYQRIRKAVEIEGGFIDVPIEWGSVASSNTYYSAYLYNFSSAYTGVRVLLLGGYWYDGTMVSPFVSNGHFSPSVSYINVGSRVIRY